MSGPLTREARGRESGSGTDARSCTTISSLTMTGPKPSSSCSSSARTFIKEKRPCVWRRGLDDDWVGDDEDGVEVLSTVGTTDVRDGEGMSLDSDERGGVLCCSGSVMFSDLVGALGRCGEVFRLLLCTPTLCYMNKLYDM